MRRVFTTGVFDLFHVGHLRTLQQARSLGDYLLVGVHTDEDVATYKRPPVIPFDERIEIIRALRCVDRAIECELAVEEAFYQKHQIDIHCQGDEVTGHDFYTVARRLGILQIVGRSAATDSTTIIERIRQDDWH